MDLPSLAVILQAALSSNPDQRKAAELSLNQLQYAPQHLVRLLQITVDGRYDMAVRQVASIHFKNFITRNWSPLEPGEQSKISKSDKEILRDNILGLVMQLPPLLRREIYVCETIEIANCLYYDATLTLGILQKLNVTVEVFNLWFQMLQQVKKSGARVNFKREHDKKVCCLGLTSLLVLPETQMPSDTLGRVFRATLDLLIAYKDQVAEAANEGEEDDDDDEMEGFQSDEDDADGSDNGMGGAVGDRGEGDNDTKLQKLDAQETTECMKISRKCILRDGHVTSSVSSLVHRPVPLLGLRGF
ncbi:hypothetical protein QQ045_008932 [Rhodiola kirilowii]